VVGFGLLVWLLRGIDWARLTELRSVPAWVWLACAAGTLAGYGLRGLRMHEEWRDHPRASRWQCLRLFVTHNAALSVVPLRGGELAYPLLLKRQLGVPVPQALASLVGLRVQDACVLLGLGLLLFAALIGPGQAAGAAVLVVAGVIGLVLFRRRQGASTGPTIGWLLSLGNWVLKLSVTAVWLTQLGGLSWWPSLRGAWGGEVAAVLPLQGPAALGTYEAGVWLMAQWPRSAEAVGAAASHVALAAFAAHLYQIVMALLAAGLLRLIPHRAPSAEDGAEKERG